MPSNKVEIETTLVVDRVGNSNMYSLTLLYSDPEISPNYPSLGMVLYIGEKDQVHTRLEMYNAGAPTPDIIRALEDVYEGSMKKFLFPRLFGIGGQQ